MLARPEELEVPEKTREQSAPLKKSKTRDRVIWGSLLSIGYPFAIVMPYILAFQVNQVGLDVKVPIEFINGLLSTAGILFGFSSLIIISKDWIDRRVWLVIIPPLALLITSGVYIGNLALGFANPVEVMVLCSSTFNANVVSTGFIVGYVVRRMPAIGSKTSRHQARDTAST
jgi:hypothetical protein